MGLALHERRGELLSPGRACSMVRGGGGRSSRRLPTVSTGPAERHAQRANRKADDPVLAFSAGRDQRGSPNRYVLSAVPASIAQSTRLLLSSDPVRWWHR